MSAMAQMLRIGRGAARAAEAGRIRGWLLTVAAFLLAVGLGVLVLAQSSFDGRAQRSHERAIDWVPGARDANLIAQPVTDMVGTTAFQVVWLVPLRADAPLPPGLNRWPEPGEAVLSPALAEAGAGTAERIGNRYGKSVGLIGTEGLQAPAELLAYARPAGGADDLDAESFQAVGFGGADASPFGEDANLPPPEQFFGALAGLVLLPVVLLITVAVRVGAVARDRRSRLLAVLGASARARACFTVGEAAAPVLAGTFLAALALAPALLTDVPLPIVDFRLYRPDATAAVPGLIVALLAAPVALLATAVLLQPRADGVQRSGARPTVRRGRLYRFAGIAFAPVLLVTVRGTELMADDMKLPFYVLGTALVFATLPAAVGMLCGGLGGQLARWGRRVGSSGGLIAGRRLATHPQATVRLVASLTLAIGLAAQAQLWGGVFGENSARALTTLDRIGSSVLTVDHPDSTRRLAAFEQSLPDGVETAVLRVATDDDTVTSTARLIGSCDVLKALNVPCTSAPVPIPGGGSDARLRELVSWSTYDTASVSAQRGATAGWRTTDDISVTLVLVNTAAPHEDLPIGQLKQLAYEHLGAAANVTSVGGFYLSAVGGLEAATRWIRLLAAAGMFVVVLAAGLGAMGEFVRHGRELAPLGVLTGRRAVFGTTALWSLLLPSLLAVGIGAFTSVWLAAPIQIDRPTVISLASLAPTTLAALCGAIVLTAWGARASVRAARGWRPTAD
ncbi:hypothetical protein RI138_16640 [Streptomyces sp. C11-1]|uniref:Permease n=1 Tax=Streptomyces durocortorensis TaxID=2811104 RepID=A0ABY9VXA0_9ACTN|nr:hypothetical protein [Streptomyces durocortorensis]WNF28333.1 hypothetical protein RI138_16640 [Streptomyces durocortorensis]